MKGLIATVVVALTAAAAAPAHAAPVTEKFRVGPIKVDGYEVKVDELRFGIPKPAVDAHITDMSVDLVDADGTPVPIQRLMLHHIVFVKLGTPDATCNEFTRFDEMTKLPALAERFYAAGEERLELDLPPGYGYPTRGDETWGLTAMVMNHRARFDRAFIEYTVTYDTDPAVKPVRPIWMDVENCRVDPVYDVPGGAAPGETDERTKTWTAPEDGRIVAAGGHVHGGGDTLRLSQPACGDRTLLESRPLWGTRQHPFYNVKPVLHEPGPVSMSAVTTATGFALKAGEQVQLTSVYDAERPHTRVMGILVAFFAPGESEGPCAALPGDVVNAQVHPQAGRTRTPRVTVPLTGLNRRGRAVEIEAPPGRLRRAGSSARVRVSDHRFAKPNLSVRRGARVRWRFGPPTLHNVTLASGPLGFSSPNLSEGRTFEQRLTRKGTYKLFCGLHPVTMTQRIVVR